MTPDGPARTLENMAEDTQLRPSILSALAQALDRAVPEPMTVEVYGDAIRIRIRGEGGFRLVEPWEADLAVEAFAVAVLDATQDEVIEEVTHTGWPSADPQAPHLPQFGAVLPPPGAEVVAGVLRWWYGDRDNPALRIEDVLLDQF
jgi:hypothetical protein